MTLQMNQYAIRIKRFDNSYDTFFDCKGNDTADAIERLKQKIIDAELSEYYILKTAEITDFRLG